MARILEISSVANPRFKFLQSLRNARTRRIEKKTAVEGVKEIEVAIEAGVIPETFFFDAAIIDQEKLNNWMQEFPQAEFLSIDANLYSKVSYRDSSGGVLAVIPIKNTNLESLRLSENPLLLIVEGVEKPGNLGAILRTADAAAIDAVIVCNMPGDLYNPNVIRASLGTVFSVPIATSTNEECLQFLKSKNVRILSSYLHGAEDYFKSDLSGPLAITVGTEADGISDFWVKNSDALIAIPMNGIIDSMNVSVATAIMIFEAKRQRSQ